MCIGIEVRRTGASGVSGAISERGFRAKKHKESGGRASRTKQLTPWLPPTSFHHLLLNLLLLLFQRPVCLFLPSFSYFFFLRARFPPVPPSCRPRDLKTIR